MLSRRKMLGEGIGEQKKKGMVEGRGGRELERSK